MYFISSRLLALVVLVICPCRICLGEDRGFVRQTVHKHKRKHGVASIEEIQRHVAHKSGHAYDTDSLAETDFDGGGSQDDDGCGTGNNQCTDNDSGDDRYSDEDDDIDWQDDPLYEKMKTAMVDLIGGV